MGDKISVIVPIYNGENQLERCLESLQKQSLNNIEFIMINDGSTDKSEEICLKFSKRDNRFKYFYKTNGGVSSARNFGLDVATGDYIGFCDCDDWVENDMYALLLDCIRANNADIVSCAFYLDQTDNIQISCGAVADKVLNGSEALPEVIFADPAIYGGVELWTKLIKRELIQGLRFNINIAIGEDAVLMYDVMKNCKVYACTNQCKYHYVFNPESACNSSFKDSFWSIHTGAELIYEKIKSDYPSIIHYANRKIILSNLSIAEKLVAVSKLNKNNYKRIRNNIKPYITKTAVKCLPLHRKINLRLFLLSRNIYIFARKIISK